MMNSIKKVLFAGVGAALITKEKAEATLNDFVQQGRVSAKDAKVMARRIAKDGRREFETVRSEVEDKLFDLTKRAGTQAQARIAALEARVAQLQKKKAAARAAQAVRRRKPGAHEIVQPAEPRRSRPEIFGVLAKHGFGDLINQLDLPESIWQRLPHPGGDITTYERIRLAAEELGPAFVKLGQFLSMRPDVLPQPLILELRKLQSNVQPLPYETMKPVLVAALGGDPAEIFADFNEKPLAAASLAQVYTGHLRDEKKKVAIKVLKPDVHRMIEIDLDFAQWFADQVHQRSATLKPFNLPAVVSEARKGMLAELDFRIEARNQLYFNLKNPHPDQVFAPAVYERYSSERVLVMDYIPGKNVAKTHAELEVRREIAGRGAQSLLHQVLVEGFFHADPHAGNVLVTSDHRLCFLDWGLVGHLTRRLRLGLAEFWTAAVDQDAERIVQIATNLARPDARSAEVNVMEKEVTIALREELNFTLGRQELGRAMIKLLNIFGRHGVSLSEDYTLMAKAVLSIEEIGRALDPDFDLREHAKPVLVELYRSEAGPKAITRRLREMLRDTAEGLRDLPMELRRLVRRLEHDDFTINFQHRGLEQMDTSLKTSANRVTLGVIIGSLIIGSSLIVTTGIHPLLFGYPALGIVGYLISALLGLYVVWNIIRKDGASLGSGEGLSFQSSFAALRMTEREWSGTR